MMVGVYYLGPLQSWRSRQDTPATAQRIPRLATALSWHGFVPGADHQSPFSYATTAGTALSVGYPRQTTSVVRATRSLTHSSHSAHNWLSVMLGRVLCLAWSAL